MFNHKQKNCTGKIKKHSADDEILKAAKVEFVGFCIRETLIFLRNGFDRSRKKAGIEKSKEKKKNWVVTRFHDVRPMEILGCSYVGKSLQRLIKLETILPHGKKKAIKVLMSLKNDVNSLIRSSSIYL